MIRFILLASLAGLTACGPEPIQSYTIPKEGEAPDAATLRAQVDPHAGMRSGAGTMGGMPGMGSMSDSSGIATAASAQSPELTFNTPESWQAGRTSSVRIASFSDASGAVDVSVTAFPGDVGGIAANINRWRGQVGLGPIPENIAADFYTPVAVSDLEAYWVDAVGPANAGGSAPRLVAVGVEQADRTWFFKMTGPADAVEAQLAAFRQFVDSVEFTTASGGNQ